MPRVLGREAVPNQQTLASLGNSAPANSWLIANCLGKLGRYRQIKAAVSRRYLYPKHPSHGWKEE